MTVKFYDSVDDQYLKFAVIIARSDGKWVFCKHKKRITYEAPGGHRENGETILDAARRELYEETGAVEYAITPVSVYSAVGKNEINISGEESFGMLYFADIQKFDKLPPSEIEEVFLFKDLPDHWTYPQIQPKLIEKVKSVINIE